jgi:NhaP-type Na+/H+ or K+/H+ antiporter
MWQLTYGHIFTMTHFWWVLFILVSIICFRVLWWLAMKDFDNKQEKRNKRRDYITLQIIMEDKK